MLTFVQMFLRAISIIKRILIFTAGFCLLLTLALLIFRKKIERYAISQMDPYFKVPVYIHDVDFTFWESFPNFSLRLNGVLIQDYNPLSGKTADTLLYAETIYLKANTWSLVQGDLSIQSIEMDKARIGLRIDHSGKENFDIFVQDSSKAEPSSFEINLKKVLFKNVDFSFQNFQGEQEYRAYFKQLQLSGKFSADAFEMQLASDFTINRYKDKSLTLLRKTKANIETEVNVDQINKRYEVTNASALINSIPFQMRYSQDTTQFNLQLEASKVPLEMIMASVHQTDIDKFKNMSISGEADIELTVAGSSQINVTPNINANFNIKKGALNDKVNQLSMQKLELTGRYEKVLNQPERLILQHFKVTTMGQALQGQLAVVDFSKPNIKANAQGEINLKALHHFFPLPFVQSISGQLAVNGQMQALVNNPGAKNQEIQLTNSKSDLDCKAIQLKVNSDFPEFREITGKVSTRNDDFVFNQFRVKTENSTVEISGKMDNLLNYLEREEALSLSAAVKAENIDLNEFISESQQQASKSSAQSLGVYVLPKNILGTIEYDIKSIVVGTHLFSKLQGVTMLRNREMDFRKLELEHIGSVIRGDFKMTEKSPGTLDLQGDLQSSNIDLKKLFAEWNNFEQEHIKSENITGNAEVKLKFIMPYNLSKGPVKEALNAQVSLKIVGGALIQLEALREIAQSMKSNDFVRVFLGKNLKSIEQKLDRLTFENLENTFFISNSKFVIPRMLIKTNVMDLVVSGWQHFDESLEYRFEFDFKDLKQNTRDAQFGEINEDGISTRLFLRMFGTLDQLQFAWDGEAKKAHKQEQREQQKQDVKSMLKTEFGMFKKDTIVQTYQKTQAPKERIELDFGDATPTTPNVEKKKREINDKFNKIRKENQSKKENVVLEFEP